MFGAASVHPIEELRLGLQAKRLSCHQWVANQVRRLLTQAAYVLMLSLRLCQAATGTRLAQAQVRSTVIQLAARVRGSTRQVLVELAAYASFSTPLAVLMNNAG
ncbi:hypothetical protein C8255_15095 [filamentous cyanobacterium CCP3]|nr:hypothetical protein C8255_15095 [filamentous cyanobacterium CCP3]